MTFACIGDIHLGAGSDYGPYPGARLADQEAALIEAIGIADAAEAEAILVAGDVFHRPKPSPAELDVWRTALRTSEAWGMPVYVIAGNHDVSAADLPTGVDVLGGGGCYSYRRPCVIPHGEQEIAMLPWAPPAGFLGAASGLDRDETRHRIADALLDVASGLRAECEGDEPILMLHWSVGGTTTASGQSTNDFHEVVLPRDALLAQGWGHIVAGHIHRRQFWGPRAFYTGSLAIVDFGEADVEHGVTLIGDGEPSFRPVADRPFQTIETTDPDEVETLVKEGAVVRIRYAATAAEARAVNHGALREAAMRAGAWRVFAIQPTIEREVRARVEGLDETLGPLHALDAWIEAQKIDPDIVNAMRDRTITYLERP